MRPPPRPDGSFNYLLQFETTNADTTMGLDSNACRFLLHAKRQGAGFTKTLTLGRLNLSLSHKMMERVLTEFGSYRDESQINRIFSESQGFSEDFLKELGAEKVDSLDATTYEGATHVHDLNAELPEALHGQYDAVIDGGTLEHVFNFPVALKSAMQAVKPGGKLFIITQCNNAMGHGFYQFSPELYYRVFSRENGFHVDNMFIAEGSFGLVPWHAVSDPAEIGRRVELVNDVQTYLLVSATRDAASPIFESWPQQSDYALAWENEEADANFKPIVESKFDFRDHCPHSVKRLIRWFRLITRERFAAPAYRPADPTGDPINPATKTNRP